MTLDPNLPGIAGAIHLAVAPVFLLTAIGGFLNVMTGRLARSVDRARRLELLLPDASSDKALVIREQLRVLARRAHWSNRAIYACVACAVLICTEVGTVFAGVFLDTDVSTVAGVLFFAGVVSLIFGLLAFLREIFIATRTLTIGDHRPGF